MRVNEKMTAIADAIRTHSGITGKLDLDAMAAGVAQVHSAGLTAGSQAERAQFWDGYQAGGSRGVYDSAFSGSGWTADTFRPQYDIRPTSAYMMFRITGFQGDLAQHLEDLGVTLDTGNLTNAQYMFAITALTRVGQVDLRRVTNGYYIFQGSGQLVTIDRLIYSEDTHLHEDAFNGCTALENVLFDGVIGNNGLNLKWSSKLSRESIESLIAALSDATTGLTVTLSKTAVTNAFGSTTGADWTALIATKPNWTISLM